MLRGHLRMGRLLDRTRRFAVPSDAEDVLPDLTVDFRELRRPDLRLQKFLQFDSGCSELVWVSNISEERSCEDRGVN